VLPEQLVGHGFHMDNVYMGRGSSRLHTFWIPLHDIKCDEEGGSVAIPAPTLSHDLRPPPSIYRAQYHSAVLPGCLVGCLAVCLAVSLSVWLAGY